MQPIIGVLQDKNEDGPLGRYPIRLNGKGFLTSARACFTLNPIRQMSGTKPFGYPRVAGPRTSSNIAAGKDCPVCVQKLRGDHSLGVFAFCRCGTCGLTCRFEAASPTSDAAWTATVEQLLFLGINQAQRPRRRGIVSCAKASGPGLPVNSLIDRNIPGRAIGRAFCARFRLGTLFAIAAVPPLGWQVGAQCR